MRMWVDDGGWIRVDGWISAGPLYLRLTPGEDGRPAVRELALTADGDGAITRGAVEQLRRLENLLTLIESFTYANASGSEGQPLGLWEQVKRQIERPLNPARSVGGIDQLRKVFARADDPRRRGDDAGPPPAPIPTGRLDAPFLRDVAAYYGWAVGHGLPPAPTIAQAAGADPRTVHAWIRKARANGVMPPGKRGRAG